MGLRLDLVTEDARWNKALPNASKHLGTAVKLALKDSGFTKKYPSHTLVICLTNDKNIQALNKQYRGKNKPTNVLSFPQIETKPPRFSGVQLLPKMPLLLGDVVISFETTKREAAEQNKTFRDHTVHMAIHGVLHLIGYDHEVEKEAVMMEKLEQKVLSKLGIANPYEIA